MNIFRIVFSYYYSRLLGNPSISGYPVSISIEPTTACNLGCTQCPSGLKKFTRPTGNLKLELLDKILQELREHLVYLTLYFQGEPYIHRQFFELIQTAHKKKIYTCTSTNGHFLNENTARETVLSGLDKLIVSVDGTSQESYEKYRVDGDFEKVIKGIQSLVKAKNDLNKKHPYIEVQFIVFRHNESEIKEIKNLCKQWKVDNLVLKTAQIYDLPHADSLLPENEKYGRYAYKEGNKLTIKNKLYNHCWRMWHSCVITWDGQVVPCCFDKDATFQMGSMKTDHFHEIWNNTNYKSFRNRLFRNRKSIGICNNCTEGTKVWI